MFYTVLSVRPILFWEQLLQKKTTCREQRSQEMVSRIEVLREVEIGFCDH